MALNTAWDALINAGSGAALVALGVWIGTLRPRSVATVCLAFFAATFGLLMLVWNLHTADSPLPTLPWYRAFFALLGLVSVTGLIGVTLRMPRPATVADLWIFAAAVVVGGIRASAAALDDDVESRTSIVLTGAFYVPLVYYALLYGRATDAGECRQVRLMSGALLLYPGVAAAFVLDARDHSWVPWAIGGTHLLVAALWLRNLVRSTRPDSRGPRNLVLLTLAVPLAAALYIAVARGTFDDVGGGPQWGVSRLLTTAILAYAILRHRLLGIDVKARWTISQSTIAAVFVAVFFIASELAQQLFSGQVGPIVGVIAAGALVFALAPLQRVAERVANAAVPPEHATTLRGDDAKLDAYRDAVAMALRGRISRTEEFALAKLAAQLGIDAHTALAIRDDLERGTATADR